MANTYILRKGVSSLSDLKDGASAWGYPGDYPGRCYFVNNITGSSTNSGLDWAHAMDQVSTAITAAEAYRQLVTTNNQYVRNVIYVQGTGTAYTAITAYPNYCDIIGVGADPRGNGSGIARITGAASAAATGSARGLGLYNLQFIGAGSYYAAVFTVLFRSVIENCTFVNGATGGLDITSGGGIQIRNCQMGGGDTVNSVTGFRVGSGGANFNDCIVEDCVIIGTTTGFENGAYLCNSTRVCHNLIYGGTKGIDDNSTESTIAGNAYYIGNWVSGTDAIEVTNNAVARVIGNYVVNGTTGTIEAATIAEGITTS